MLKISYKDHNKSTKFKQLFRYYSEQRSLIDSIVEGDDRND